MGTYAFLDSFEHIDRILSARAHQVEAKHYIPIYWLAMFEPGDVRTEPLTGVRYAKDPDKHFVVQPPYLISDATTAMGRLKRRTPALATLGGEAHRKMLTSSVRSREGSSRRSWCVSMISSPGNRWRSSSTTCGRRSS